MGYPPRLSTIGLTVAATCLALQHTAAAQPPRPNIVVILADDIGYGDLGCYGAMKVETPNLDRLAREGMRFTDAHSPAAVCTPSRYAMLTGQYAWRHPPGARILSGLAPLSIPPGTVTVPSILKKAGYATGVVGKWHLGLGEGPTDYNGVVSPGPKEVGFGRSFIIPATGDRVPCVYVEDGRVVGYDPDDPIRVSYDAPIGDEPTGAKNPELLTVQKPSHGHDNTIVHGISRIGYMSGGKAARWKDEEMADVITGQAVAFIETNKDKPFFLYFATHDVHVPRVPHPRFRGTSQHGTRGDAIHELDASVGVVLDTLDRLKLTDNTLVLFSSDNGGVMDDGYQDGSGDDASGHKCNGPLRGYKGGLYEGGSRVPFLARWPGKVPAGKTSGELVGLVDLLATVAAVSEQRLPTEAGPDSFDVLPALLAEKPRTPCRDHLVTQAGYVNGLAVRQGSWKLIPGAAQTTKKAARQAELYNLDDDLAETTNLAARHPEKVRELAALLEKTRSSGRSRPASTASTTKPNIVVILADDMGFSDIGCYGGELNTPNLDRLAAGGLRFSQFYNTARCCPTRASLLTGLYPQQAGVGHMMEDRGFDAYRGDLNRRCVTIAEGLKPAGYRNYAVGKWHVTKHVTPGSPQHNWPLQRGFDRYYGLVSGGGNYFDPFSLARDNTLISPFADPGYRPESYYLTDAISDHAVRFIAEHDRDRGERPFFLYVAYTSAHWPMHAPPEEMAKVKGKYDSGYEPIRRARFEKTAATGLIDPKQGMSAQAGDWSKVDDEEREAACMEVYAAMVDRMDRGIGEIVAELERTKRLDNTLIFFLQDNGACAELTGRNPTEGRVSGPRAGRPSLPTIGPEVLSNRLIPIQTRDGYPVRQGPGVMPGPSDTFVAYGEGWANVSNTPFREYKHWVHEGGISTPLIAHWPAGIGATRRNAIVRDPGHLIDLKATCLDVAGLGRAADAEGISLRPAFEGRPLDRPAPIFWEHEGNRAVRDGRWKLVAKYDRLWELYDIDADRVEARDLAASQPERVERMSKAWDEWAGRVGVRPWHEVHPKDAARAKKLNGG